MYYKAVPNEQVEVDSCVDSIVDQVMDADLIVNFLHSRVTQILEAGEAVIPADAFLQTLDAAIIATVERLQDEALEAEAIERCGGEYDASEIA